MCSWQVGSGEGRGRLTDRDSLAGSCHRAPSYSAPRVEGPLGQQAHRQTPSVPPTALSTFRHRGLWEGRCTRTQQSEQREVSKKKPQGATGHTTHTRNEQGEQRPSRTPSLISHVSFPVSSGGASSLTSSPPSSVVVCLHSYHGSPRRGC